MPVIPVPAKRQRYCRRCHKQLVQHPGIHGTRAKHSGTGILGKAGGDPSTIMSSGVTIEEVYKEVKKIRADMVWREDLEALADTVEILSNPATMQLIRKSDEDIQCGRVKEISSVDDLLRECS